MSILVNHIMPIVKRVMLIKGQALANEEIYWLSEVKYHWFDQVEHELKAIRINNRIAQYKFRY